MKFKREDRFHITIFTFLAICIFIPLSFKRNEEIIPNLLILDTILEREEERRRKDEKLKEWEDLEEEYE